MSTASGMSSHAEGGDSISAIEGGYAAGIGSHAEGLLTTSVGDYSHAEGRQTVTTGDGSHSEGYSTSAGGKYSHAEGKYTTAVGIASHTSGYYNIANADYSQVLGGSENTINASAEGSAIIAASGITATTAYTLYTGSLIWVDGHIKSIQTTLPTINIEDNKGITAATLSETSTDIKGKHR